MNYHSVYKLAYLFTTFPPEVTGSAIFNWERIQWLAKKPEYKIIALVPESFSEGALEVPDNLQGRLIIETYPSKPWPIYNLLQAPTFQASKAIRTLLDSHEPDLLTVVDIERLFWFGTWNLTGRHYAENKGIPYVTEYHTDYYNHLSTYTGGNLLREILVKPINRGLYEKCDVVLSISPAASRSLKEMGVRKFKELSMYGLDLSDYSPQNRDRRFLQKWISEEEKDCQIILYLGRIAHEKRIDVLIEAFDELQKEGGKYTLIVAGDGPEHMVGSIKNLAGTVSNVHFTGFVQGVEKAKLIASCDIFCSPSPYETFGRTLIEAMSSGVPVVSVDSGGQSDYLKHGVNAYMVPPNDIASLKNALSLAAISNNDRLISNALNDAADFSTEKRLQTLHYFYQQLLTTA